MPLIRPVRRFVTGGIYAAGTCQPTPSSLGLFDLSELTSVIFRPVAKALLKTESRNQSALALETFAKGTYVQRRLLTTVDRRNLLRFAMGGVGAAAVSTVIREPATARAVDLSEKRKARYQANSAEVQNFYRVNSYPTR